MDQDPISRIDLVTLDIPLQFINNEVRIERRISNIKTNPLLIPYPLIHPSLFSISPCIFIIV